MTKYAKLLIAYSRLLGEFTGMLMGISMWEIQPKLKVNIEATLKELRETDTDQYDGCLERSEEELLLLFAIYMRKEHRIGISDERLKREIEYFKGELK